MGDSECLDEPRDEHAGRRSPAGCFGRRAPVLRFVQRFEYHRSLSVIREQIVHFGFHTAGKTHARFWSAS
jgi:hypothetical protein